MPAEWGLKDCCVIFQIKSVPGDGFTGLSYQFCFLGEVVCQVILFRYNPAMNQCKICPFECGVDRVSSFGVCGLPWKILVSHYQRHFFEEPMISGSASVASTMSPEPDNLSVSPDAVGGSGTIFFTGCNGRCVFCQNYKISQRENWEPVWQSCKEGGRTGNARRKCKVLEVSNEKLFKICKKLIDEGAHNINFVSPTPYTELLVGFLKKYKSRLGVPVVWNSNGYEKASTLRELDELIDIYLPDLKYFDEELAVKYSGMPKYFEFASGAIHEMWRQVGRLEAGSDGLATKGLIIRHLVLPGCIEDSKKVLKWVRDELGPKAFVALMAQYYPTYKASKFPSINRRLAQEEYDEVVAYFEGLGFEDGLKQELSSAEESYTPEF